MRYEDMDFDTNEYGGRNFHICRNARWCNPENRNVALKQISQSPSYVRVCLYEIRQVSVPPTPIKADTPVNKRPFHLYIFNFSIMCRVEEFCGKSQNIILPATRI